MLNAGLSNKIGNIKVRLYSGSGRFCFYLGVEFLQFFRNIDTFFCKLILGDNGGQIFFSPAPERFARAVRPFFKNNGIVIPVPEYQRRVLGLQKNSAVEVEIVKVDGRFGLLLKS